MPLSYSRTGFDLFWRSPIYSIDRVKREKDHIRITLEGLDKTDIKLFLFTWELDKIFIYTNHEVYIVSKFRGIKKILQQGEYHVVQRQTQSQS